MSFLTLANPALAAVEAQRSDDATCVITAQSAQAVQPVQPDSGTGALKQRSQTAADFDASQVPLSTFMLNGTDYADARAEKVRGQSLISYQGLLSPGLHKRG